MKIGDGRDRQPVIGGPARRLDAVSRHVKPQQRLDAKAINAGRRPGGAEAGEEAQEMTARDHGRPIVMPVLISRRLQPNWGMFMQIFSSAESVVRLFAAEQSELGRIARGLGEAEMFEGMR